jgi:hypothetical protein
MSASSSSNAEEQEEEQHQFPPDLHYHRSVQTNINTDSDHQHYSMKLRSHAHNSSSTPALISNIFDAAATTSSSMPHEVTSRSADIVEARRQRSTTIGSSEQISHRMASTEVDNSPRKRKSYPCSVCHKLFPSGQSLGGHKNGHKNANANPRQEVDQEAGGTVWYTLSSSGLQLSSLPSFRPYGQVGSLDRPELCLIWLAIAKKSHILDQRFDQELVVLHTNSFQIR